MAYSSFSSNDWWTVIWKSGFQSKIETYSSAKSTYNLFNISFTIRLNDSIPRVSTENKRFRFVRAQQVIRCVFDMSCVHQLNRWAIYKWEMEKTDSMLELKLFFFCCRLMSETILHLVHFLQSMRPLDTIPIANQNSTNWIPITVNKLLEW